MCCQDTGCGCKNHDHHHKSCGCQGKAQFGHWLWTKAEKIDWLECRLESLQGEVKAYQDRIDALKAE